MASKKQDNSCDKKQTQTKKPPFFCTFDSVFSLLRYAPLRCRRPCQHRRTQPLLMSRLKGGSGGGFLQSRLVRAVVRLSPEGAYIYTVRVTATLFPRSSKWVRLDGSLRGEEEQLSSIRHGMIQLDCDGIMPLSHCGSAVSVAVSQQEGHRFHLASLWRCMIFSASSSSFGKVTFKM